MKQVKIIIADDQPIYIDGIKKILNNVNEISIIGEALNGNQLLNLIKLKKPHLVLLDISMPIMDGLEAARIIKDKHKSIKVIILTIYDYKGFIKRCQAIGVEGYLLKDCGKQELLKAINTVCNGGVYYCVNKSQSNKIPPPPVVNSKKIKLSSREKEVLLLMANDNNCFEIAFELNISESTVRTYKQRLMIKSGTNTLSGLISWAYNHKHTK